MRRWTVKFSKAKPREDGVPQIDLAVPSFGYKNHVSIDRRHELVRGWTSTHAAAHDGARLEEALDIDNTASGVWADSIPLGEERGDAGGPRPGVAHPSQEAQGTADAPADAAGQCRQIGGALEGGACLCPQKGLMGVVVRTIGLARARAKIGLVNLAYNMRRLVWLSGRTAPA